MRIPRNVIERTSSRWMRRIVRLVRVQASLPYNITRSKSQYRTLAAMICLLCVSGTAARADERPSYGDTIIVGSIGDASNLIPMLSSDSASHDIGGLIYNGLVKYDKDLNLVGDLAKRWEGFRDGMTLTFYLRQGGR